MAKDYFQDIMPPGGHRRVQPVREEMPEEEVAQDSEATDIPIRVSESRGIRNISAPQRSRPMPGVPPINPRMRKGRALSRVLLWTIAIVAILALLSVALIALRSTSVTVTPKSHAIQFDDATTFRAYPESQVQPGLLAYTVRTLEFEDSEVVKAEGTSHVEKKANGSITVLNAYSDATVKLIKDTRFEAPGGLVYRTPAEVIVPGRKGTTPGQITISVIADKAGDTYNIGPTDKFTLPGLKSNADMYAKVTAKSDAAFSGGFIGDEPAAAPGATEAAIAAVRTRLEAKARAAAVSTDAELMFPGLMQVSYQDMPNTEESGGNVRIHQKAIALIPVFSPEDFAAFVGSAVSADAEDAGVRLVPGEGYAAQAAASSTVGVGETPLDFKLFGRATLVWNVDPAEIAQALAGRDQSAFQTVINGFTGVQEARARIEPFWKNTFPADPSDIKVKVEDPKI